MDAEEPVPLVAEIEAVQVIEELPLAGQETAGLKLVALPAEELEQPQPDGAACQLTLILPEEHDTDGVSPFATFTDDGETLQLIEIGSQ